MNPTDQTTNPSDLNLPIQSDGSPNDGGSSLVTPETRRGDHRSGQQLPANARTSQTATGVTNPRSSGGTAPGLPVTENPQQQATPNQTEAQLSEIRQMMMQLVDKAQENERTMHQLAVRQQRFEEITRSLNVTAQPPQRQTPGVTFRDRLTDPSFPRGHLDFSPGSTVPEGRGSAFETPHTGTAPAFNPHHQCYGK
ncbi:uncharacterized protein LOC130500803 [Raphanus sativus]|uniref:Uncharacterized protein LOC130500803 n=1 Tax=Raphanus sativus TaxID=3726 RepID=A0A9W3CJQ1_RAPSA|nr:uncharacterized protein LOC130500803 [Raphanus sativus]